VALRLDLKPIESLLLSPGTGVPPWDGVSIADEIRENPGLGAGDPDALCVKLEGPGLSPLGNGCI